MNVLRNGMQGMHVGYVQSNDLTNKGNRKGVVNGQDKQRRKWQGWMCRKITKNKKREREKRHAMVSITQCQTDNSVPKRQIKSHFFQVKAEKETIQRHPHPSQDT